MTDTPPEIAEMIHARIMALSGSERFLMGVRMHEAARAMALASFPPGLTEAETRSLLFERFYGQSLEAFLASQGIGIEGSSLRPSGNPEN
ncbi:MAG TPA: hypothetical protein VK633_03995 [Verrucomicrobiae bacterium]|nr:hypothetical protein [Verrucomicrobiae bacterium]